MDQNLKRASDAERLLNDPAFLAATAAIESATLKQLKETPLDGKSETNEYVMELVRVLQTGSRYARLLGQHISLGKLSEDALERKTLQRRSP